MVLLDVSQGEHAFEPALTPGARIPHGTTALGRACLAAQPRALFERHLARLEYACEPGYWPRIRNGIEHARQDYENLGFCFSLGEWNPEVFAVGMPLVSADGSRVLAFNCSGPLATMTRDRLLREIGPRRVALRDAVRARSGAAF